jgi:hypothetical protein
MNEFDVLRFEPASRYEWCFQNLSYALMPS